MAAGAAGSGCRVGRGRRRRVRSGREAGPVHMNPIQPPSLADPGANSGEVRPEEDVFLDLVYHCLGRCPAKLIRETARVPAGFGLYGLGRRAKASVR